MTKEEAITNIIMTDYSGLIVSIDAKSGYETLVDEIIESLKTNLMYPPSFELSHPGSRKSEILSEFVKTELLDIDLTKCTKQTLLEKLNTLKMLYEVN